MSAMTEESEVFGAYVCGISSWGEFKRNQVSRCSVYYDKNDGE